MKKRDELIESLENKIMLVASGISNVSNINSDNLSADSILKLSTAIKILMSIKED